MILEWSIRVTLLALGVGAVLTLLRVRGAAVRHLAWTGVMLAMLLMPVSLAWVPRVAVPVLSAPQPEPIGEPLPLPEISELPASLPSPRQLPNEPTASPVDWLSAYFFITCLMLARLFHATLWVRRIQVVAAPITVGWLRPVMLLPKQSADWSASQREAVVLHEQEHIRRRDPLIRWLSLLNRALFWFHPLSWWLERKLSALAEEACDAAVLARGHAPADYARYLIDVARLVEQAGGRVRLHAAFGDTNPLSERVRQILRYAPAPALSRSRSLAVAALGSVVLILSAACTLERRESAAPGEATMAEMRNRGAQKGQELQAKEKALRAEVQAMTPEQAREIEAKLKANPDDRDTYRKMVRYYQRVVDVGGLDALALWYIENQPSTKVYPITINPAWDRAGYERGKVLWLAQLKKPGVSAQAYRNAAMYLESGDKPLAEQVLLDAQKAYPKEGWAQDLGRLYALTLLGSVGGTSEGNVPRGLSAEEAHGPFARSVLAKLHASQDMALLGFTVQRFLGWGLSAVTQQDKPLDFDPLALAKSLNDRALSLNPQSVSVLRRNLDLTEMMEDVRLRNTARDQMNEADRLFWLRMRVEHIDPRATEADARDLVALAVRLPDNPESANGIFFGNLALGRHALKRGDRSEAVRFLRAAIIATTPTERIRYKHIDMTFARGLVDAGERTAVAEFLERLAQFSQQQFYPYAKWATEILQGSNPDLTPYFVGA